MTQIKGLYPYAQGQNAYSDNVLPEQSPCGDTAKGDEWIRGWEDAQRISPTELTLK